MSVLKKVINLLVKILIIVVFGSIVLFALDMGGYIDWLDSFEFAMKIKEMSGLIGCLFY